MMKKNGGIHKGDGLLFLFLLVAALTLPWSLDASRWAPQGYRLTTPAIVAAIIGALLGSSPLPQWLAWVFGALFGAEYSLQFVGGVFPKLVLVWRDLREVLGWLWEAAFLRSPEPIAPFARSLTHVNSQAGELIGDVQRWLVAVQTGEVIRDTTFMRLILTYLVWLLVMHAGIELFRTRRSFLALLPLGVGLISNVAYTSIGIGYVYLFFAVALLTMVWAHTTRMESVWERRGIDIARHLRSGAMSTGMLLSALVIVVALLAPYITYDRAIGYFWDVYGPRFEEFYDRLDRAFAGRNPVPTAASRPGGSGLGEHLVYSSPELRETELFVVRTSDPAPVYGPEYYYEDPWLADLPFQEVPKRYWRQRTYDAYTGRGWENSQQRRSDWAADTQWREPVAAENTATLTQIYTIIGDVGPLALNVNEPLSVDEPYTVVARSGDDIVALVVSEDAGSYTVTSQVPEFTEEELQAAEDDYPAWVRERYLSVENVPESVQEMAREVVGSVGAQTRYEMARAIEAYLRQFQYDLEVDPPPPGADIVEYFVFDARKGFCDYTASAMVVMLRSVGVAARYASGYNMGYYDDIRRAWVVQEVNAHAWPEVYFPGLGWVEFEPTPSQTTFTRPSAAPDSERVQLPPPPPVEQPDSETMEELTLPAMWGLTLAIIAVIVFLLLRPPAWLRRKRQTPAQVVGAAYGSLLRHAGWLGLGPRGGQTPQEYLRSLREEMLRRGARVPTLDQDLELISRAYQRLRYSAAPITRDEGDSVERAYRRLRGPMWRLLITGSPKATRTA